MDAENTKVVNRAFNLFMILFLAIGFVLGGVIAVAYHYETNSYLGDLKKQQQHLIELQVKVIEDEFDSVVRDVILLSKQNELISFLDSPSPEYIKSTVNEYLLLSDFSHSYDQIRFINDQGHEVIRVNYQNGSSYSVSKDKLQDKSGRYYFQDSFRLDEGSVFVSPLDLNIEQCAIELPWKPMIRFGTPVYDSAGNKRGVVILNFLAGQMLDIFIELGKDYPGDKMFLNSDGYWLAGPDKNKKWGFMFKNMMNVTFANEFPKVWNRILQQDNAQFQTAEGLFTYSKVYPLHEGCRSSSGSDSPDSPSLCEVDQSKFFWVLMSYVSADVLNEYSSRLMARLFLVGGACFFIVAVGAWYLAFAIVKRDIYQSRLMAMALYDFLTGLPNRKNCFDRLELGITAAKRYDRKLALLYIDLDGFKSVNDTKGHDAGDELLVKVGRLLAGAIRKTDMAARLGGDEFAIILTEVESVEAAAAFGEKIIRSFSEPFALSSGNVTVGASVGVAVYPDHADALEMLVKAADNAMYNSKKNGKNTCTVATSPEISPV